MLGSRYTKEMLQAEQLLAREHPMHDLLVDGSATATTFGYDFSTVTPGCYNKKPVVSPGLAERGGGAATSRWTGVPQETA